MMPSSYVDSFPPIVKLLIDLQPEKVIDIGPGWGKYGLACREYLPDLVALDAIEVRQGRLSVQDAIYDNVWTGDVRSYTSGRFWSRWGLALIIDVIEHLPIVEGHLLLDTILTNGCGVLVATPKTWIEQYDEHNPYEEHVSFWEWTEFQEHNIAADASTPDAIIYHLKAR